MDDKHLKIVNKILNEAFWLGYILEIKRELKDYNKKILSDIIDNIYVKENKEIEIKFKERKNENG